MKLLDETWSYIEAAMERDGIAHRNVAVDEIVSVIAEAEAIVEHHPKLERKYRDLSRLHEENSSADIMLLILTMRHQLSLHVRELLVVERHASFTSLRVITQLAHDGVPPEAIAKAAATLNDDATAKLAREKTQMALGLVEILAKAVEGPGASISPAGRSALAALRQIQPMQAKPMPPELVEAVSSLRKHEQAT